VDSAFARNLLQLGYLKSSCQTCLSALEDSRACVPPTVSIMLGRVGYTCVPLFFAPDRAFGSDGRCEATAAAARCSGMSEPISRSVRRGRPPPPPAPRGSMPRRRRAGPAAAALSPSPMLRHVTSVWRQAMTLSACGCGAAAATTTAERPCVVDFPSVRPDGDGRPQ